MNKTIFFWGALVLLLNVGAVKAEPQRFLCMGEFYFSDGEGEGFDGSYKWSFYLHLDEEAGVLVSAPMFPKPVAMDSTPQQYRAIVKGEWCFKPFGPSDDKSYCAAGTRMLELNRASFALLFSYTPDAHGKPLGALKQGRCQADTAPP